MAVAQFIVVVCFVVILVVFTVALCAAIGGLAWMCLRDIIIDWKQYQLSDRVIIIQEVEDSMRVLGDTLRAKGLLVGCEATACSQSELD